MTSTCTGLITWIALSYEADPALRRELVYDIQLAVLIALGSYRGDASFKTFTASIAQKRCISYIHCGGRSGVSDRPMPPVGAEERLDVMRIFWKQAVEVWYHGEGAWDGEVGCIGAVRRQRSEHSTLNTRIYRAYARGSFSRAAWPAIHDPERPVERDLVTRTTLSLA